MAVRAGLTLALVLALPIVFLTGGCGRVGDSLALDGVFGAAMSVVYPQRSLFAPGYSTARFRAVRKGMSVAEVQALLGWPLVETMGYKLDDGREVTVVFRHGKVDATNWQTGPRALGVANGTAREDLLRKAGMPSMTCWHYAHGQRGLFETGHARTVCFDDSRVSHIFHEFTLD